MKLARDPSSLSVAAVTTVFKAGVATVVANTKENMRVRKGHRKATEQIKRAIAHATLRSDTHTTKLDMRLRRA